jgi:hypothetical protein
MTTYIGIDPGETTGVAIWMGVPMQRPLEWCAQLRENSTVVAAITGFLDVDTVVACERFMIGSRTHKKKRTHAPDIIGDVRGLCERRGATFLEQNASDAKSFATDDLLRNVGWYVTGKGHAMDAARHLVLAVARRDKELFSELVGF